MADTEMQTAIDEMQRDNNDALVDMSYRMTNPKLSNLRAQNPFISVMPFPNGADTVLIVNAGDRINFNIPPGSKMMTIFASGETYVSRRGNAEVPVAPVDGTNPNATGSFTPVNGTYYYCEEINQISIVAVAANTRVSVAYYAQM